MTRGPELPSGPPFCVNFEKNVTNPVPMWYTEKYYFGNKGVFATQIRWIRRLFLVPLLVVLLGLLAPAARAEADFDQTLDRLGRLQALANAYTADQSPDSDPVVLTLAYTRTGDYNTDIWKLTAGLRDPQFEAFVNQSDDDCMHLQSIGTVTLPNGQAIDFSHLLASMNLVYNGLPITGSWGGDCMQLASAYQGQAADADGYYAAMQPVFNLPDDGSASPFGDQDLRADLDSVILGSRLEKDTAIADLLRAYFTASLTDHDRVYEFISLSFGSVDTSNTAALRDKVYNTLVKDTGMQLLLYTNGLWSIDGWQLKEEYAPALRGATDLFADYLSAAVGGEKVKSSTATRMITMAGQALSDALTALGDSDAASAALAAHVDDDVIRDNTPTGDPLTDSAQNVKERFDVKIFQLVLLVLAAAAVFVLLLSAAMLVRGSAERSRRDRGRR